MAKTEVFVRALFGWRISEWLDLTVKVPDIGTLCIAKQTGFTYVYGLPTMKRLGGQKECTVHRLMYTHQEVMISEKYCYDDMYLYATSMKWSILKLTMKSNLKRSHLYLRRIYIHMNINFHAEQPFFVHV